MMPSVSSVHGTCGMAKLGSPPPMAPRSPTVRVSMSKPRVSADTLRIASSVAGSARVSLGAR